jgi:hypothetical protein
MPHRTAMEFKDGDRYKHYGLFRDLAQFFPQGVCYLFGTSSDREGWFFTQWRQYGELFRAQFTLRHADSTLAPPPGLTISSRALGRAAWRLIVSNVGRDASAGPVTVAFCVPWPLTAVPMHLTGDGRTCTQTGHVVVDGLSYECVRAGSLAPGTKFPPIEARGALMAAAPARVLITAVVSGGSDINTVNNVASALDNRR